jgi:ADP-dependent NAD(P)H-hydrate dehydratase / NAD(P)H-hydrate epimerase
MKIFSTPQVREIDKLTIANEPISSVDLMERASMRFTEWFTTHFKTIVPVTVFAGSGNNGGDALAISRLLIEREYKVRVFFIMTGSSISDDCKDNLNKLKSFLNPIITDPNKADWFPNFADNEIIIDGLFGTGLSRPVEGNSAELIRHINQNAGCIVSVDIPSGLNGEDNRLNDPENIIKASYTVRFEFPLLSFFMSENEIFTGTWVVIQIGLHKPAIESVESDYFTIEPEKIRELIVPRKKYSHKGTYGHALIIAGRFGMMGAAILSSRACLRGGAGLVTSCIPLPGYDCFQASVPEALIQMSSENEIFNIVPDLTDFQAVACGPAIGRNAKTAEALRELLLNVKVPLVLDADALNILSEHSDWLKFIPPGTIITPHPKEFDRLAGESDCMYERHLKQLDFAGRYRIFVILKGAHTIISTPEGKSFINMTGNPGMATGGTGDVLTGLLASLLAQGYDALNASMIAVYIHGMAGDLALQSSSMEAIIAGDLIDNIGKAFQKVKENGK